jgi:2-dehydropantoate 2-reductase
MLQDLKAGKTLELAPLVGAVIELADLVGLDVPSLRTLCAATALLEVTDRRDRARDVALARRS